MQRMVTRKKRRKAGTLRRTRNSPASLDPLLSNRPAPATNPKGTPMRNYNIKPTEALPKIVTDRSAHGRSGSFFRTRSIGDIRLNEQAHEYGGVRQVDAHLINAEYDRAFVLPVSSRVMVEFSRTRATEEGDRIRSATSASMSKDEARQLRDKLNSLDLD